MAKMDEGEAKTKKDRCDKLSHPSFYTVMKRYRQYQKFGIR